MTLFIGFIIPLISVLFFFLLYKKLNNPSVIDIAWGINVFLPVSWYLSQYYSTTSTISIVFCLLAMLWGLRLTSHIGYRNLTEEVDGRYHEFERKWKEQDSNYKNPDRNYLQFFLIQSTMSFMLSLPFYFALKNPLPSSSILWTIFALIFIALVFEAIADYQLLSFKRSKVKTSRVCKTGLWRYSRHPNYFFEISIWVLVAVVSLWLPWVFVFIGLPLMIGFFILNVTGIPAAEAQAISTRGQEYKDYVEQTSSIIPWFPKKL